MKRLWIVVGIVCVAGVGVAVARGIGSDSRQSASDRSGSMPPKGIGSEKRTAISDFRVTTLDGRSIQLSALKGKVVVVDFWATWCPPCIEELPHFKQLYAQYKDKGLEMIGIALDEEGSGVVSAFVKEHGVTYPVAMGSPDLIQNFGGILGIPTTFIIDKNGMITHKLIGYQEQQAFEQEIQRLLSE